MTPRNNDLDDRRDPKGHWPADGQSLRKDGQPLRGDGPRRKDAAMLLLEFRRESYIRLGRRALLQALLDRGVATADDVRAVVELPEGMDPKLFGAVPGPLVRANVIRRAGFASTGRPVAHARPVSIWRLTDARAAERWLAAYPPAPLTTGDDPALLQGEKTPESKTPPVPRRKEKTEGVQDDIQPNREGKRRG